MLKYGKPIVLVGGGGYTIENVSRAWAYETSICLGKQLDDKLPDNLEFSEAYRGDKLLHYESGKTADQIKKEEENTVDYVNSIVQQVFDHLKKIDFAPNIQVSEVPTDFKAIDDMVWEQ